MHKLISNYTFRSKIITLVTVPTHVNILIDLSAFWCTISTSTIKTTFTPNSVATRKGTDYSHAKILRATKWASPIFKRFKDIFFSQQMKSPIFYD